MSDISTKTAKTTDPLIDKLNTLKGKLIKWNSFHAINHLDWFNAKLDHNIKHEQERHFRGLINQGLATFKDLSSDLNKVQHKGVPNDIKFGEIVHVSFGIGIGDEIKGGHYSVILSRKGKMFLIAPLTSKEQKFGKQTLYFESIDLPAKDGFNPDKSYVSFSQIRYVHARRIELVKDLPKGKNRVNIGTDNAQKILDNYYEIVKSGIEN